VERDRDIKAYGLLQYTFCYYNTFSASERRYAAADNKRDISACLEERRQRVQFLGGW